METNRSMAIEGQQPQQQAPQPQQMNWTNIGSGIAGTVADLIMGDRNTSRQWKRAKEGMEIQMNNQMKLNEFNQKLNLDTWNKTNYEAQRKHMENAGLSIGMMYGGSGAGGAIMGNAGGGAEAPNAPNQQYTPVSQNIGMAMQLELLQAQKANIEADTKQKLATVPKTGAETTNIQADTAIKKLQIENQKIINNIAQQTMNDVIETAEANRTKAEAQAGIELTNARVLTAVEQERITEIRANSANTILTGALIKSNTNYNKAKTKALIDEIAIGYINAYANRRNANSNETNAGTNLHAQIKTALNQAGLLKNMEERTQNELILGIAGIITGKLPTTTTSTTQGDKGYQQTTTTHE